MVFGDDTPLDDDVLMDLADYMKQNQCAYRWTPGKFVIVDNSVTYHSREPFEGRRKVFAAIGQGTKPVETGMTHLVLNTADKMPMLGLGLWKMPNNVCGQVVYDAIKSGYRLLDSACDYGNEHETGKGIKRALDEGIVKREELFVVSKLWNTFHRPEHVREACLKSMQDLGVDYLDLYLIHFPIALAHVPMDRLYPPEWVNFDENVNGGRPRMVLDEGVTYMQTYRAMEELVREGLVRNIGVCNVGTTTLR